jgi:positive regulator of sigma E activity
MGKNYIGLKKALLIITIQSITLFAIFYILSSTNEVTANDEIELALLAALMIVGSFITLKSLTQIKTEKTEIKRAI